MKIGDTVYKGKKEGILKSIEGRYCFVDFGEGREEKLLNIIVKSKPPKKKKKKVKVETNDKFSKYQIKNYLLDLSKGFQDSLRDLPVWSEIMQEADKQNHFASDIVLKATSRKPISEKQAWAAAFFASENNIG